MHLGLVKLRWGEIDLPTANPKPWCGRGYKVPEMRPTFLGNNLFVVHLTIAKLLLGRMSTFLCRCHTNLWNTYMTQNNNYTKPKYFWCGIVGYYLSITARSTI